MIEVNEKQLFTHDPSSSKPPSYGRSPVGKNWSPLTHFWQPPTDMYETDKSVVVLVEIAGMRESEFVISLEKRTLVVSGERAQRIGTGAYHQLEIMSGEFITVVELPAAVQYDKVSADYEDGFLKIELPKSGIVRVEVKDK